MQSNPSPEERNAELERRLRALFRFLYSDLGEKIFGDRDRMFFYYRCILIMHTYSKFSLYKMRSNLDFVNLMRAYGLCSEHVVSGEFWGDGARVKLAKAIQSEDWETFLSMLFGDEHWEMSAKAYADTIYTVRFNNKVARMILDNETFRKMLG